MNNLYGKISSLDLKKKSGIYKISCKDHFYIGSSKDIHNRLHKHRISLENGTHHNKFMQNAFNKYGKEEFTFEIVEFCPKEDRLFRESHYIATLEPDLNLGPDPLKIMGMNLYSDRRFSESWKREWKEGSMPKMARRAIDMFDFQGNYIKTFRNAEEAADELGYSEHYIQIAASCYGSGRLCGMHRFRYMTDNRPLFTSKPAQPQTITKHFDYFYRDKDNNPIRIGGKIKELNDFLVKNITEGNFDIKLEIRPKVRFKSHELREKPVVVNPDPSIDLNVL